MKIVLFKNNFRNFFPGLPSRDFFLKNFFRQKYTNDMSLDSVFDGDYESAIIFRKICT
jgi:hypothetical protein